MASLKTLRVRIKSVKSTQKITKAMKMVAAAKLRRAQEQAQAARPYAERMETLVRSLASSVAGNDNAPKLLIGTGRSKVHLIIAATSDRGLCGAFNSSITRAVRKRLRDIRAAGDTAKLYCVGKKAYEHLNAEFGPLIVARKTDVGKPKLSYADADSIAQDVMQRFDADEFDSCTIVYNRFKSAISQVVTFQQLIPLPLEEEGRGTSGEGQKESAPNDPRLTAPYEYEPGEEQILAELLPKNVSVQVYRALLENAASEQGARMSAMDSATRNAGEMIKKLTLVYNRTRQAAITKELIEIISGAEAV